MRTVEEIIAELKAIADDPKKAMEDVTAIDKKIRKQKELFSN